MTENQDEALALARRIARADGVVWLEYPTMLCLRRAQGRWWQYRGQARPDMTEGDDSDLAEAADGDFCRACERPSIDCSREPCPAVIEDRGED